MGRRGAFRASLTPFGGGKLNIDAAYRVDDTPAVPPAPPPTPTTAPPPAAKAPVPTPVAKPRATIKRPVKRAVKRPVRKAPKLARPRSVRKTIRKVPLRPITRKSLNLREADRRRLGARRPRRRMPPKPRMTFQRRMAEFG